MPFLALLLISKSEKSVWIDYRMAQIPVRQELSVDRSGILVAYSNSTFFV